MRVLPGIMGQVDDEFGYGPEWARGTTCCGKPVGCTNMSDQCVMQNHPWKRRNVPAAVPGGGEDQPGENPGPGG